MTIPLAAVLDTNWYIGVLKGYEPSPEVLVHSIVTRIELLSSRNLDDAGIAKIEKFLLDSEEIGLSAEVALRAAELRRSFGGKLPDAVIAASAEIYRLPLLTRDRGMTRYAGILRLPALKTD